MLGLAAATEVSRRAPERFTADLSPEWAIWGPQGGYLATVALRAAGEVTGRNRPASINVHFVGAGASGAVDIDVLTNRDTTVATSVTVRITQRSERGERLLLVGSVWGVDGKLPGLEHQRSGQPAPSMSPDGLANMRTLLADREGPPPHPFWLNVESRPLSFIDDWDAREAGEPAQQNWYRFVDGETFDDPWLDAGRPLVILDVDSWGAATRAHVGALDVFAPTIELTARFISATNHEPWLLSDAHAPVAENGLIAATGNIWTTGSRLAAVGGSTLLCRPAARRPDGR